MDKLTKEEVLHIADLGRLKLTDEEVEKFSYQLKQLFNEIDKVNSMEISNDEKMISPSKQEFIMFDGEYKESKYKKELIENAPVRFENFIEVAGVFDE